MDTLRHLAFAAGRGFALLAVLVLAWLPALPAHAHLHAAAGLATVPVHALDHGGATLAADESGNPETQPRHAADGCFICHVSIIPGFSAMPLPTSQARVRIRAANRTAPPDILPERLPDPPRPLA